MTEPPEPRRPEEGGGEDDWLEELGDDIDLDRLGQGEDVEDLGELGGMLGAWRDDVGSAPVGPIAERAQEIHDLNQRYETPSSTGGPPAMTSAMEQSEHLRLLGNQAYERVLLSLNGIDQDLDAVMKQLTVTQSAPDEFTNAAAMILGEGHPGRDAIMNAATEWSNGVDPLKQLVSQLKGMVSELTGPANMVPDGFNTAANMVAGHGGA